MGMRTGSSLTRRRRISDLPARTTVVGSKNQKARSGSTRPGFSRFDSGAPDVRRRSEPGTLSESPRSDPSREVSVFSGGLLRSALARSDTALTPDPPTCGPSRYAHLPGAESSRPSVSGALSVLLVRFDPFQAFLLECEVAAPSRLPTKRARWVICTNSIFKTKQRGIGPP